MTLDYQGYRPYGYQGGYRPYGRSQSGLGDGNNDRNKEGIFWYIWKTDYKLFYPLGSDDGNDHGIFWYIWNTK